MMHTSIVLSDITSVKAEVVRDGQVGPWVDTRINCNDGTCELALQFFGLEEARKLADALNKAIEAHDRECPEND